MGMKLNKYDDRFKNRDRWVYIEEKKNTSKWQAVAAVSLVILGICIAFIITIGRS